MLVKRNGFFYFTLVIIVMMLGLSSRRFSVYLPDWINLFLGDALWALMVYFLFGLVFRTKEIKWIAALALLFSFGIEISQLYHSPWIDTLRQTRLGGLVLGYVFLWSDMAAYSIGISAGVLFERFIILTQKR